MKCIALITAGGSGIRMNSRIKKQYLEIGNRPILAHTLSKFNVTDEIDSIVLTVPEEDIDRVKKNIVEKFDLSKVQSILPGGSCRQDSVFQALKNMDADSEDIVLIHDGVRPFVSHEIILECIASLGRSDCSVTGIKPVNTIKRTDGKKIINTLNREELISVQTPQAFRYGMILNCHKAAVKKNFFATDDSALVEKYGEKFLGRDPAIKIVDGNSFNIKITGPNDLVLASVLLEQLSV
ncbi:MAG: 2-C-methyl-D-erythritol 4-phosphate cytidylyltransferase [Candidatus Delongbacteria bacterium]